MSYHSDLLQAVVTAASLRPVPGNIMRASVRHCLRCSSTLRTPRALTRLRESPLARYVTTSEEVQDALYRSLPVVSLETAITSHGLPYEQAISTASSLDDIIRVGGAVPAVIGIIEGKIKIGLNKTDIERLANQKGDVQKWKVGKRDIAPALAAKVDGGTTVSATSFLSHLAGIDVFVTGGIGGVHRGAQQTMDISSDLTELGKTPTTVVCAGAKSILDIGLTLEYLETLGVTVTTFGHSKDFPAFYARQSGFQAPSNVNTAREAAELIYLSKLLETQSGTLIGVPIPEKYEEKSKRIQAAVEQAVRESEENGIATRGKEVTPWILARVKELSGGESVESNIALIENNARVGTAIAVELSRLIQNKGEDHSSTFATTPYGGKPSKSRQSEDAVSHKRLAVVGCAAVDIVSKPALADSGRSESTMTTLTPGTTVPGTVDIRLGGVARNVHEAAFRSGASNAVLISPVGKGQDPLAAVLRDGLKALGATQEGLVEIEGHTPSVNMILDGRGTLQVGVAATQLVEQMAWKDVKPKLDALQPNILCFDGNISVDTMQKLVNHCTDRNIETAFEPTSDKKACKLVELCEQLPKESIITHFAPNVQEIIAFSEFARAKFPSLLKRTAIETKSSNHVRTPCPAWAEDAELLRHVADGLNFAQYVWLKNGSKGMCLFTRRREATYPSSQEEAHVSQTHKTHSGELLELFYFKPRPVTKIVNSVGAGDSMLGAILSGLSQGMAISDGELLGELGDVGQRAAVASLESENAVGDLTWSTEYMAECRQMQKRC